ncbi:uncharacterized protein TNCV_1093251 [Trichonephila clavipes]|nr:uncharacterized protein TNCV_1093251 [Trichonephila clavipes]
MKRKENFQWLPKELHQLKYEAISVPQGSVRLVKKTQERKKKSSTCYLLITKGVTSSSPVPLKTRRKGEVHVKFVKSSNVLLLEWYRSLKVGITFKDGNQFNSCQVIYSQFGLAIHQNDHQARRRFVEWAQNEIAVVPDFHMRILFSDEAHFWLNGYVNKQNCRIWSEANPQVYVETPLHPEKLTVWCALWAGGILLQKR